MSESKAVQDLTNEFLKNFFELVHAEAVKEKAESKHPETCNDRRNDSFAFNYSLPEYLVNSEHVQKEQLRVDYPLMGSGFPANVVKEFFKANTQGVAMDLKFIIVNFKNQDHCLDYYAKGYQKSSKTETVKDFNVESFFDKTKPTHIMVEKTFTTESFTLQNNKSGYVGRCEIKSTNGKLKEILVYGQSNTKDKQIVIRYDGVTGMEEPKIEHFKHVADINSFYMVIEQIIYGIKDVLQEKSLK